MQKRYTKVKELPAITAGSEKQFTITPHLLESDTGFHYVISVNNSQEKSKKVLKGFANEDFKTEYAASNYATKRAEEFAFNLNHLGIVHTNASKAIAESQQQANKTNQKVAVLERNLGGYKTYRVVKSDSFSLDDAIELYALSKPNSTPSIFKDRYGKDQTLNRDAARPAISR